MQADEMAQVEGRPGRARRPGRKLLAALGTVTVLALGAGGVAAASASGAAGDPAPATVTASSAAQPAPRSHPWTGRLLRRTVHAQFVLRTKGGALETFDYDRGVLRSVTASTIVIAPADAPTTTVSAGIAPTTRFVGLTQGQLQPGDRVALVYQGSKAVVVGARAPRPTS